MAAPLLPLAVASRAVASTLRAAPPRLPLAPGSALRHAAPLSADSSGVVPQRTLASVASSAAGAAETRARRRVEASYALYLVTDDAFLDDKIVDKIRAGIDGGVTAVQLRLKHVPTGEFVRLGEEVRRITEAAGIPLFVDDRLDVALAVDADGLHIGGDDLPWRVARRLLGPEKLLGCSTYGQEDLVREALHPEVRADILGSGAIFPTSTKTSSVAKGLEHLGALRRLVAAVSTEAGRAPVPVVAIGGVGLDSAAQCIREGADGVAAVRSLLESDSPEGVRKAAATMAASIKEALMARKEE